jgi:subtilisin family serine protease
MFLGAKRSCGPSERQQTSDKEALMQEQSTGRKLKAIVAVVSATLTALVATGWCGEVSAPSAKVARELTESHAAGPLRVIVMIEVAEGGGPEQTEHIKRAASTVLAGTTGIARTVRTYDHFPFVAMEVADKDGLMALGAMPEVRMVVPDRLNHLSENKKAETGTFTPQIYPQNVDRIGAQLAWNAGYTGAGWYVAIPDTGVLTTHELFAGKNIVEACFSSANDCPNGQTTMFGRGAAQPFDNTFASYEHGTHVAGIAVGNSGKLFGVAKDASLIAIQVFSRFTAPADCSPLTPPCLASFDSDELAALDYIYSVRETYPIAAVNMSFGGDTFPSQSLCDTSGNNPLYKIAIDNLRSAGIASVVASGNDGLCGSIEAPACISSAISVGAVNDTDAEANFNDWHYSMLKVLAPGVHIYSAIPDTPSSYAYLSGTSMSAPHVAGAWAILKQKNPQASVDALLGALADTGVPVRTACANINDYKPRIQIDTALSPSPTPVPLSQLSFSYAPTASPVLNFSQAMPGGVGPVAGTGSLLDLRVGFAPFAGPVDIYLAYTFSAAPTIINNVKPDLSIQSFAFNDVVQALSTGIPPAGAVPWMQNIIGPVTSSLFGIMQISLLPPGTYSLYILVTSSGVLNNYYVWSTSFSAFSPMALAFPDGIYRDSFP